MRRGEGLESPVQTPPRSAVTYLPASRDMLHAGTCLLLSLFVGVHLLVVGQKPTAAVVWFE
jgi:hypothetical protein